MAASNSAAAPSAPAAEDEASPESVESNTNTTESAGVDASDSKLAYTDGAGPSYGLLDEIDEISYDGAVYKAVFDDVYKLDESLGEEYQGYPMYSVEGYEESEMLALYDAESDLAQFFRAE